MNKNISWNNPASSDSIEVFFGTDTANLTSVYSGPPITSYEQGMMDYYTQYFWKVVEINENGRSTGLLWDFTTILDPAAPVYADFEDNVFPPPGWSYQTEDENWWYISIYSGYGIGNYCALQSFYSAPIGNVSSLVTQTFLPTEMGDSLIFDHAYASDLGGFVDQLEILYSEDAGSTWTSLVVLDGGMNGELVTAPPTEDFFVPNADQWGTLKYELPSDINRLKFTGISARGNNLFLDNIELIRNSIVNIEADENVPTEFSLSQNYPNPFNPATTIEYSIPEDGNVSLTVYNALGEKVETLVNDYTKAGTHKINFNATDFSSGIYYYRLSSGKFSSVMKMIVLK
ncbi:MAG: T9SS type A sorting domain-containing protein [Aliifodinibius sp.]|nr:T9SS type A sorting domain-containing protein [Fodinibius sp.]NIV14747.1 T9SS type A sorting domain-containing protein [Fodinibius sp.]NIY25473.1 T9SS type A sorting domain-containing protein [Fodinibius sp.]